MKWFVINQKHIQEIIGMHIAIGNRFLAIENIVIRT